MKVTLHQGAIEAIFLDSMASMSVRVERPIIPTSIKLSMDEAELADPHSHPIEVHVEYFSITPIKLMVVITDCSEAS